MKLIEVLQTTSTVLDKVFRFLSFFFRHKKEKDGTYPNRHLRERPVIHCWNMLVKDKWVGSSTGWVRGDTARVWTLVERSGWSCGCSRQRPWEKSVPCIRKQVVWSILRKMLTAETELRKEAKKREKRWVRRCLGGWVGKNIRPGQRRGRLWGAREEVMRKGAAFVHISCSFTFSGLCLVLGVWNQRGLTKWWAQWWCTFHSPLCEAKCWIAWKY